MMIRLGIFGGSFDPLHNSHIKLVENLFAGNWVDRLLLVPANKNPLKNKDKFLPDALRLKILEAEFSAFENVEIFTGEIQKKGLSYTVDTLREIAKKFPAAQLKLIIGSDHLSSFIHWKEYRKILELAQILVVKRKGCPGKSEAFPTMEKQTLIDINLPEISSGEIQEKILRGKDISQLVSQKTLQILKNHDFKTARISG